MQLVNIWKILIRKIREKFNKFSNICVVLLMLVCSFGELEIESLVILILILLETLIKKSLAGYVFIVGGGWGTLYTTIALSTTEAEFRLLLILVRKTFSRSHYLVTSMKTWKYQVVCDNRSIIFVAKNQMFHERTKHIDVLYHFVSYIITCGEIVESKISTHACEYQLFSYHIMNYAK